MKKYLAFFKISIKRALQDRARSLVWLVWDAAPPIMMLFFWAAVFQTKSQVAGYDFFSIALYYLVVIFVRGVVVTHVEEDLKSEIYTGKINFYFAQPANFVISKFYYKIAYKLLKFIYSLPIYFLLYFVFIKNLQFTFQLSFINLLFFILSVCLAFLLNFFIKFILGTVAFWLTDIDWLIDFHDLVYWFFGGVLLPLNIMPAFLQKLANVLPYKYLFYLPSQILIGKLNFNALVLSLIIQLLWLAILFIILNKVYKAGIKIYSAYGG